MKKHKIIVAALIFLLLAAVGNLSAKTQLTLRGAYNMFSANGKDTDYKAGENDFPKVPAYKAMAAGIGFQYMFSDSLGVSLEFQGTYIFRTPAQILISPAPGINLKF